MPRILDQISAPVQWLITSALILLATIAIQRLFMIDDSLVATFTLAAITLFILLSGIALLVRSQIIKAKEKRFELINQFSADFGDQTKGDRKATVELFRLQIFHTNAATRSINFAVAILCMAIIFVALAGYVINIDYPQLVSLSAIKNELEVQTRLLLTVDKRLATNLSDARANIMKQIMTAEDRREALDHITSLPEIATNVNEKEYLLPFIKDLQLKYNVALGDLQRLDTQRLDSTTRAASLLLFRVSVLAISIFTALILLRSYQSNMTMANIFRARMIALLASDQDAEKLALRAATFSAEHVKYGKDQKASDRLYVIGHTFS